MPIVQIEMLAGRSAEQKAAMIKEVTDAIVRTTGAKPEATHIVIREMKKEDYGVGGKPHD